MVGAWHAEDIMCCCADSDLLGQLGLQGLRLIEAALLVVAARCSSAVITLMHEQLCRRVLA